MEGLEITNDIAYKDISYKFKASEVVVLMTVISENTNNKVMMSINLRNRTQSVNVIERSVSFRSDMHRPVIQLAGRCKIHL